MCKTTNIIDSMYRYIIVALLAWILYVLLCITNWITITHQLDEKQVAEIISTQMKKEFEYDRQTYKFIIEE